MSGTVLRLVSARLLLTAAAVGMTSTAGATIISYTAALSGLAEAPPNASPGTGFAIVDIDRDAHTMRVRVDFSGLIGNTTASHIHGATAVPGAGTAGVMTTTPTFADFPLGVTAGSYDRLLDMTLTSSYNPAFLTAHGGTPATAEADLWLYLHQGRTYLNVHSTAFPGGEIRGFLVPAPGAAALLGLGGLFAMRRRRN